MQDYKFASLNAGVFWRATPRVWSSERHLGFKLGRGLERDKNASQGVGVRPTLLKPIWWRTYDRELQNEKACIAGYKFACICKWQSKMTEAIFNQSRAELRIQGGSTHEIATMLENSIQEDLGSISMASKTSRNFKIDTYSVLWS